MVGMNDAVNQKEVKFPICVRKYGKAFTEISQHAKINHGLWLTNKTFILHKLSLILKLVILNYSH